MRTLRLLIFCAAITAGFWSCQKLVKVHCTPYGCQTFFVGFDSSDIRELTCFKYEQDGQFSQPIDSIRIILNYYNAYSQFGDTLAIGWLYAGYDWKVVASPVNRIWKVSKITFEDVVHLDRPTSIETHSCPLAGYVVDSNQFRGYVVYLKR